MREGWKYCKLGDVGTFVRCCGILKSDFVENGYPCIHYGQIHTKFGLATTKHLSEISKELYDKSKIASSGDIILAITSEDVEGSCKCTAWIGDYDIAVGAHAAIFKHRQVPKYIAYCFRSRNFGIQKAKYAKGFKVTEIKPSEVALIEIPVPPIEEQQRIVTELDLLSSIIEKQKAQLKELDTLAQSIFYDMFGDPVTNEKGWEITTIGNCFPYIKNGANIKQDKNADGYPISRIETLSSGKFNRDRLGYANIYSLEKYSDYILNSHDLLVSHINSKSYIGRTVEYISKMNEVIIHGMNLLRLKENANVINSTYYTYYTHDDAYKSSIAKIRKDAVNQSSFSIADFKTIKILLPPLSLQQQFADKIQSIESQKSAITKSIAETQKLFDYTMDKYFG